mgnify:CR=1 FL=1
MGSLPPPGKGVRAILRGEGGQELVKGVNLNGKRQNPIEGGKGVENPKKYTVGKGTFSDSDFVFDFQS